MSDIPLPVVPDYNTKPTGGGFNLAKMLREADGSYSSFWPLLIVLLALSLLFVYEISYLRYRKLVVSEQLGHFVGMEKNRKEQSEYIRLLHQDLQALAPTHPDVAPILKEFFPEPSGN